MKLKFAAFFFLFGLATTLTQAHPIKLTTGKLQINTADTAAQLTLHFFRDDFESELRKMYPQPAFNLLHPTEEMQFSILDYIRQNTFIWVDEGITQLELSSISEGEENIMVVQLRVVSRHGWRFKELKITNTLLFSSFNKQSNILYVYINDDSAGILQFYPQRSTQRITH